MEHISDVILSTQCECYNLPAIYKASTSSQPYVSFRIGMVSPASVIYLSPFMFITQYILCNETCITAESRLVVVPFHFLLVPFFSLHPDEDF